MQIKYFSMFSGIGGFELGIQRAFDNRPDLRNGSKGLSEDNTDTTQPQVRAECVGYSEIDKYASSAYERNFRHGLDCPQRSTIRRSESDTQRNERQGLQPSQGQNTDTKRGRDNEHDRNELDEGQLDCGCTPPRNFGDITKINEKELPDFDLLVGGFPCQAFSVAGKRAGFNDTRGTLFFDIARILKEKQPRHLVLENVKGLLSNDSGRTFTTIIGVLTDMGYSVEWQVLNSKDFGVPQNRERIIVVGHLGNECRGKVFPIIGEGETTLKKDTKAIALHNTRKIATVADTVNTLSASFRGHPDGDGRPAILQLNQPTHSNDRVVDQPRIRRLTPVECERLQGFPDNWTKYGINEEPISDTQRYKMCGNAVTTNVIQAVMERLIDHV